ncbi:hypothetical protein B0H17DRAFT_1142423 [Mycena rosella]|uniref:Uncharacterized protein n=1 Tax=Mycena rosella TaxID=1033263 RepID=A0AAD7CXR0_MYCRO|nr:hypothetical protein B0H17DRAFT_1142423 [Mycena rosella]
MRVKPALDCDPFREAAIQYASRLGVRPDLSRPAGNASAHRQIDFVPQRTEETNGSPAVACDTGTSARGSLRARWKIYLFEPEEARSDDRKSPSQFGRQDQTRRGDLLGAHRRGRRYFQTIISGRSCWDFLIGASGPEAWARNGIIGKTYLGALLCPANT